MPLNKTEKEKLVIELYNQNKTIREIAEVHMSFADISTIIKKYTGEWYDKEEKSKITLLSKNT